MQDLLSEEEFLQKPYNPWRRFFLFYMVEIAIAVLIVLFNAYPIFCIPAILFTPSILGYIMICTNKCYSKISDRLVIRGLFWLYFIYFLPIIVILIAMIFDTVQSGGETIAFSIVSICYGLGILAIIAISREERRKHVKLQN